MTRLYSLISRLNKGEGGEMKRESYDFAILYITTHQLRKENRMQQFVLTGM